MRSSAVVAGLVAVANAQSTTVTQWEDVTVTYCAPSVTQCVVSPSATYTSGWENWQSAAAPGSSNGNNGWAGYGNPGKGSSSGAANTWAAYDPSEPEATGWANVPEGANGNSWADVPEGADASTWAEVPAGADATWAGYPAAPAGTDAAQTWENVPAGAENTWSGYPAAPAGTDAAQTWENVPAGAENTWSGYPAAPAGTDAAQTWKNVPIKPTPVAGETTWSTWAEASTVAVACPSYTATGPPSWFSNLPSEVASSLAAKWTGAPPSDWCYYSYSTTPVATRTSTIPAASTWAVITSSVPAGASTWAVVSASSPAGASTWAVVSASSPAAASTGAWQNVDSYKGAANAQAGSVAMAGLAGLAAIMLA